MKAFVFPGQGSQVVGMGKDLYKSCPKAKMIMDHADDILGFSLTSLMFDGPLETLTQTQYAQPALVCVSYAMLQNLLNDHPIQSACQFVLGHSLGEYSALVAANVLRFEDALTLVHTRGKAMQDAVPRGQGIMAAVLNLDQKTLASCLVGSCVIANDNAPGQIVISGLKDDVLATMEKATQAGSRRCIVLPVSAPFHSPLMQPAADVMEKAFQTVTFSDAVIPVICNVTAKPETDGSVIRQHLKEQICGQVRFTQSIQYAKAHGVESFIEVGPGSVLTNLIKRIDL
ncbi:MAG: Malonyl CoA-acyl carrier protein transacylase [Holosporales bacterium]